MIAFFVVVVVVVVVDIGNGVDVDGVVSGGWCVRRANGDAEYI